MDFFADHHLHSNYSDGRSGIRELAKRASLLGLEEITIADHGPNLILNGVKNINIYLQEKKEIQEISKDFPGLKIQIGAEANVISLDGKIDLPQEIYQQLDLLIIGLHPFIKLASWKKDWPYFFYNQLKNISPKLMEKAAAVNTKALKQAILNHKPQIIAHPGLGLPIDPIEIARTCFTTDTAYEINAGHRYQQVEEIISVAKTGVKFIVNSDAHFVDTVGQLEYGATLLKAAKVPKDRIINARF